MSNDNNNTLKENITGETPGQLLAKQRKKSNLSERDAADALKISVSRLRSIENDDFSVFPSETYIKGHLKNYSRLLKCEEQEVLSAYRHLQPEGVSAEPVTAQGASVIHHQHKRWWLVYGILVIFALLWVLSYWLLGNKRDSQETAVFPESTDAQPAVQGGAEARPMPAEVMASSEPSPLPVEAEPSDPPPIVNNISPTDSLPGQDEVQGQALSGAVNSGSDPLQEGEGEQALVVSKLTAAELVQSIKAKEEQKKEAPAEQLVEGDTLEFGFESTSWIQVTDATGKVLFKGLNKPGAELALNGTAPFNIVIGNVEGTSLVYNGENVTLDPPAGKKILRLTLGG